MHIWGDPNRFGFLFQDSHARLGARRLDALASVMYGKAVPELTGLQASGVINCLKGIKAGEIDVQAALSCTPK